MPWAPLPTPDATGGAPEPTPLPELLDTVLAGLGAPRADAIVAVHDAWPSIVGDELVDHAHPISIEDGCLRIAVDSPAWASHLQWSEREIIARIQRVAGTDAVVRLATRVTRR